jgi:hypothetical protein
LTINGDLTLSGTTVMELGGTERGITYDAMDVTGSIVFGGTLTVSYITAYTPLLNDSFNLFSRTGGSSSAFSVLNLPALDAGLSWNTTNLYTSGTISVVGTAIPESGTYAAVVGLVALALAMRWRRSGGG